MILLKHGNLPMAFILKFYKTIVCQKVIILFGAQYSFIQYKQRFTNQFIQDIQLKAKKYTTKLMKHFWICC